MYSYLAHLSEFTVAEGAMVERGQRIGLSGATGRVTGPHLHWTMRFGSARVDPLSLVEVDCKSRELQSAESVSGLALGLLRADYGRLASAGAAPGSSRTSNRRCRRDS